MIVEKKSPMQYLDKDGYKKVHELLTSWAEKEGDEPIPRFELANQCEIERLIAAPQRASYGQDLYPEIEDKAAIIFYTICKGQIFANGNKRMSTISFIIFLSLNGKDFDINPDELTAKAIELSKTNPEDFELVKNDLAIWMKEHIVDEQ